MHPGRTAACGHGFRSSPGSFDSRGGPRVCADEHLPDDYIPALLGALMDKSIVTWQPTPRHGTVPDAGHPARVRRVLAARLGEEEQLRRRHLAYYQEFARRADAAWLGPRPGRLRRPDDGRARQPAHRPGLRSGPQPRATARWSCRETCGSSGTRADSTGRASTTCGRALAADTEPSPERLRALWAEALVLITLGEPREAGAQVTEMADTAARFADTEGAERARSIEALSAVMCGDVARAVPLARGVLDGTSATG